MDYFASNSCMTFVRSNYELMRRVRGDRRERLFLFNMGAEMNDDLQPLLSLLVPLIHDGVFLHRFATQITRPSDQVSRHGSGQHQEDHDR